MKTAVVGSGYWGKNLVRNFHELGVLAGICDNNHLTLSAAGRVYQDTRKYTDFGELLNDAEINAVAIASPAERHYEMVNRALRSGKDVFVEKPLALSVEEGAELVSLSKKHERILMVGHLLEYHPGILKLKELIDTGELGKIYYVYSNRLNLGKIRREENILWSFAPHDISVILLLLNEMPDRVIANGGNYLHRNVADVTVSAMNFPSGVKSHIFVSWLHPFKEQKLVVVGEKKMAVFDDVATENSLLLFPHAIDWIDRIPTPRKEDAENIRYNRSEPLKIECRHFIDCVNDRLTPKTDGENGLRVLRVLSACQQSLGGDGKRVFLKSESKRKPENIFLHETATIDGSPDIGSGTNIWHYSHVMSTAKVGRNCNIGQNVFIDRGVVIGNNVKIQNNVSIYAGVTLEDDVFCGPSMTFTNVINPRSTVPRKDEFRKTIIRKGASLGAHCTIVCGSTIGEYAFIGAGSVITRDVPDYALVYGNPGKMHGWMCECGVKLDKKDEIFICGACHKDYILDGKARLTLRCASAK